MIQTQSQNKELTRIKKMVWDKVMYEARYEVRYEVRYEFRWKVWRKLFK
jgi:hypothetical protein